MHISIIVGNGANKTVECGQLFNLRLHEFAPKVISAIRAAAHHVRESGGTLKWVNVNFFDDKSRLVTRLNFLNPTDADIVSWRDHSDPRCENPWFWQAICIAAGEQEYGYSVEVNEDKDVVQDLLIVARHGDKQVAFRKDGTIAFKNKVPKEFERLVDQYHADARLTWERRARSRLAEMCFEHKDVTTLGRRTDTVRQEYPIIDIFKYPNIIGELAMTVAEATPQ